MVDSGFGFLSYAWHIIDTGYLHFIYNIVVFCKSINKMWLCVNIFVTQDIDVAARENTAIRGCFYLSTRVSILSGVTHAQVEKPPQSNRLGGPDDQTIRPGTSMSPLLNALTKARTTSGSNSVPEPLTMISSAA